MMGERSQMEPSPPGPYAGPLDTDPISNRAALSPSRRAGRTGSNSVFEEKFGRWLFWALVVLVLAVVVALAFVLMRERRLQARRLILAELIGIVGGVAAVWLVQIMTNSRLADIGGAIDAIAIMGIWITGAFVALIASYAAFGLLSRQ